MSLGEGALRRRLPTCQLKRSEQCNQVILRSLANVLRCFELSSVPDAILSDPEFLEANGLPPFESDGEGNPVRFVRLLSVTHNMSRRKPDSQADFNHISTTSGPRSHQLGLTLAHLQA